MGQGAPHGKVRRRTHRATLRREVEEHHPHPALRLSRAPQRGQGRHPISEARNAFLDGLHVRFPVPALRSAPEHRRDRSPVELGDGHHDGGLHRGEALGTPLPLVDGLELQGMSRQIGHVETLQHRLRSIRVVVRRPAHEGKARQR